MTTFARIQDNVVYELFSPPTGVPITDCFVADPLFVWIDVSGLPAVQQGWTWNGVQFSPPAQP